ncbi:SulP family inorganic anion transporter [Vibrio fortis]|uniref:SulP family inorganic anion transporter n=1 Tax=Vibrio fortis TaxID=212667 RepID=UPI002F3ECCA7
MFEFPQFSKHSVKNDVLSGLTVALALVPEAVAFAFVAGVDPMVGLYAAFIVGLITSIFGGRPGMISGATGAMAVVMVSLVATHGVQYLFAAIMLAGLLQIAAGLFKLGKFIRIVPHPVMIGFVNGLAIVIFLAQLGQFKAPDITGALTWLPTDQMTLMLGLVALTMAIIHFLPKFTTAVPSSLVAIVTVTALVVGLDLETRTVVDFLRTMSGDDAATLAGSLPTFSIPAVPFNLETIYIILPYAVILAAIGLIESLLTLTVLDEMTNTRGQSNRECVGQGMANVTCSVFGAMGGCAMIGQSMINVNSGGRGLAVAVFVGVIASALMFAWQHAKHIYADTCINEEGSKEYKVNGPIFFGSTANFLELFNAQEDPQDVIVDFANSRVTDHSAIEAIDTIAERYAAQGKTLHLRHLSQDCVAMLHKAGSLVEANVAEDPIYKVMSK